jgi:hypothetical protein
LRVVAASTVVIGGVTATAVAAAAPGPLSVGQYRAQAAAICGKEEQLLNAYQAHGSAAVKLVEQVEFESKTKLADYRAFARLRPPPQFARLNARMLSDQRVLLQAWPAAIAAAKRGPAAYGRASGTPKERKAGNDLAAVWKKLAVPFCNR